MTESQKSENSRSLILGTAGHIDHGKSSLVLALSGTNPDRLPEEKQRNITITLLKQVYTEFWTPSRDHLRAPRTRAPLPRAP